VIKMPELLLRTKAVLEDCSRHLGASNAFGSEIESYLTQYLLVVLSADIQQEIYRVCDTRAAMACDDCLTSFVSLTSRRVLRSVKKDEIVGFAALFGDAPKQKLNNLIGDSEVTAFNNAILSRHDVAHKLGTQITFDEFRKAVIIAEKILASFEQCLAK